MIPVPATRVITADGEYAFVDASSRVPAGIHGGKSALLEIDITSPADTGDGEGEDPGTFGGGTVTLGYQGESGLFVPYRDDAGDPITAAVPYGRVVTVPISGIVALKLEGATDPSLKVSLIPKP